jgi:hypothetical protein
MTTRWWSVRLAFGAFAVVSALLLSSCGAAQPTENSTVVKRLDVPDGWVVDGIVALAGPNRALATVRIGSDYSGRTASLDYSTGHWRQLTLPNGRRCAARPAGGLLALNRWQLAYFSRCVGRSITGRTATTLESFSFRTHRRERLFPYFMPIVARDVAYAPSRQRALLNDGHGLDERLRWLYPTGMSGPLPVEVDRVGDLAWSPRGEAIVMFGQVGLGDAQGVARTYADWTLLRLNPESLSVAALATGLADTTQPAWSPDGRLVAVALQRTDGESTLSLIRWSDGYRLDVAKGDFAAVTWIDHATLLAIRSSPDKQRGEMLDVSRALQRLPD